MTYARSPIVCLGGREEWRRKDGHVPQETVKASRRIGGAVGLSFDRVKKGAAKQEVLVSTEVSRWVGRSMPCGNSG